MVVQGTISGTFVSNPFEASCIIKSYSITNKSGGSNIVRAGIVLGSTPIEICRVPSPTDDSVRETLTHIIIPKGYSLFVTTSGTADYYFSVE